MLIVVGIPTYLNFWINQTILTRFNLLPFCEMVEKVEIESKGYSNFKKIGKHDH